jgi:anti-sigma regulatory factor (Ser/Thr protein kinase)
VTQREKRTFELGPGAVGLARRFAAEVLRSWGCAADDVVLAVDELAANAVLHARTGFTVALGFRAETLTIEVTDYNPRLPVAAQPPQDAVSGRGLMLVEAISTAWGVRAESPRGKVVWAEFDATVFRRPGSDSRPAS